MTAVMVNGTSPRDPLIELSSSLNAPHRYLQPTLAHQQSALAAAKAILDPLANEVAQAQIARRNENRRKRKRGSDEVEDPVLQLRQIYTKGLGVKQVWEQARRVLDAACNEVERGIEGYLQAQETPQHSQDAATSDEELEQEARIGYEDMLSGDEATDHEDGYSDGEGMSEHLEEDEDIEEDSDVVSEEEHVQDVQQAIYQPDPNNLNDGFFSIDDFNKQSHFLEQMDARGDDDNPSDEDDIDWDADPLAQPLSNTQPKGHLRKTKTEDAQQQESESDEEGPTFGNADLNADDSDENMDDIDQGELDGMMPGLANTNDVRYADFFEPPAKKPSKSKRTRALPKTQPPVDEENRDQGDAEGDDADLERAMADVRRDLLDSEDEDLEVEERDADLTDSDDNDSDVLPRVPASKTREKNLSTHERQQLQIAEEIRRLESLNVSKKPWTLSGEASAGARPINSLVEEDLEFERTGKPVPVITAEVSNDIEALIKRRILARDFDEVVRRLPTALDSAADARRGRAEVDDTKPTTSLGEIYESEYQRTTDPTSYLDKRSATTKKQHDEIDKLWKEVRDQLDLLGNLHIKPKRAEIEVKTVEDKPRIAMEDARPAVSGMDADGAMLAPQEIYKPGTDSRAESGEVLIAKTGASRSKEEMTREEKTRKRRRDKERLKKANAGKNESARSDRDKTKKAERESILKDLQKGRVKVIGKGGATQELSTKKRRAGDAEEAGPAMSGGALKL